MKLTGVTRKRLHTPWVLGYGTSCGKMLQAQTFSVQKGPNRLIEKLTEDCHVQDETSASEF